MSPSFSLRLPQWLLRLGSLLLGSFICLSAALYNGFPLVSSDTGTYLVSALRLSVPDDRPALYGLFIRATSLHFSFWLVAWAQSLLLAALLLRCLAIFAPRLDSRAARLAALGLLAWLTGFAWYCGQLMPDIFTAVALLALTLLVLGGFRSRLEQGLLLLLLLASILMHSSNLLSVSLAALGFGAVAWWLRLFARGLVRLSHWAVATAVALGGWVAMPALHASLGGGFVLSRATPVFLMGRLVEAGLLDRYLDDHCADPDATWLCTYRHELPNDAITFLWDGSSPYNKTGGLEANLSGYRRVVYQIATSPRYYPALASLAVQSTLRQLTRSAHGDGLVAYRENSNPYWHISEVVPFEMKPYLSSMQNHSLLHFDDATARFYNVQLAGLLVLVLAGAAALRGTLPDRTVPALLAAVCLALGLITNAFTVGTLANVSDRLQGRVAWLLPLGALLVLVQWLPARWWPTWLRAARREAAPVSPAAA